MIITLDGPAGVGKTTLAKRVAEYLAIPCLDTGAMFRYLALHLGVADLPREEMLAKASEIAFSLEGSGETTALLANGRPIGPEIRTEEVGALASALAKKPEFREILLQAQRKLAQETDLVAEGRDMGTVVFPAAEYKFFLQAQPEVRAKRRWLEMRAKDPDADLETIARAVAERDEQDRTRKIAPLAPASDAIVIDTSNRGIEDIFGKIKEVIAR